MMKSAKLWLVVTVIGVAVMLGERRGGDGLGVGRGTPVERRLAAASHGKSAKLPLRFEPNVGQFDAPVRFVARQAGATLFLTDDAATLALHPRLHRAASNTVLAFNVVGGAVVAPRPELQLAGRTNYFLGADPARWRTDVPSYARVVYPQVLAGVDLVYHGEAGALEYDFVVAPRADAKSVVFAVEGGEGLSLTSAGDLVIATPDGELVELRPRVFQQDAAGRDHEVRARFRLASPRAFAFEIADYDHERALVIDPVIAYSTYLGGAFGDEASAGAIDGAGNMFLTGDTSSTNFPTKNALQGANAGGLDVFVAKLNAAGDALVYASYLGGAGQDGASSIAVDGAGGAHVVEGTTSMDFPTHAAAQPTYAGAGDGFALALGAAGDALIYSTFLGGSGDDDAALHVAVDAAGNAYVAGTTNSTDFPTKNPLQAAHAGGAYDGYVSVLGPTGAFVYSTYLGGSADDAALALAVDATGRAYVAGKTASTDFPVGHGRSPSPASRLADAWGLRTCAVVGPVHM